MRRTTLYFALLSSSVAASASAQDSSESVILIDGMKLPPTLDRLHEQLRQALGETARSHGWHPINLAEPASCVEAACVGKSLREAGAQRALVVAGSKTSNLGYDVSVELWTGASKSPQRAIGACRPCLGDEMIRVAAALTSQLIESAQRELPPSPSPPVVAAQPPPPVAAPPVPAATLATSTQEQPQPSSASWKRPVGWTLVGVGAAALLVGIPRWISVGEERGCDAGVCIYERRGGGGPGLTLGGAVLSAGGLLMLGGAF